jgi:cobalt-zinc-cadmium efflux system membrane fusion protein
MSPASPSLAHPLRPRRLARAALELLVLCILVCVAGAQAGCQDSEAEASEAKAEVAPELPYFEGEVIRLPPAFAERIGVKTTASAVTEIAPVVHVTGVLEFDEQRIAAVGSRISGRVRQVKVIEGTKVEPGDVLATMESAELGKAQAEIFSVKARAQYADNDERRKKQLLKEGIASQRAVELALQESTVTDAELRAAKQRVKALGGDVGDGALGLMSLTSPISGDVVKVHVFRGQAVEPSYTAFTIADRSTLWVRLAVFEGEVANIRPGDQVEISTQVTPDDVLTGTVTFISSVLDPVTRSAEVRVIVPNEAGKLRVGQAVNARIRPSASVKQALCVPRAALVQVDGKPTIFVATGDGGVVPRPVELGAESRDLVEIKSGVKAGELVVTEGVFALKSELFR